jgi:glycerol-3-phosphate dehydrogenase (NAD(P)+)
MDKEKNAKTPIINAVYAILYEGGNAKDIFKDLTNKLD